MMSTGLFSINGILTFIAMNFYLVSDSWSRVAGVLATSFSIFLLSMILPKSNSNNVIERSGSLLVSKIHTQYHFLFQYDYSFVFSINPRLIFNKFLVDTGGMEQYSNPSCNNGTIYNFCMDYIVKVYFFFSFAIPLMCFIYKHI